MALPLFLKQATKHLMLRCHTQYITIG